MVAQSDNTVVRVHRTGGPEVLQRETAPVDQPGEGQVLLRQDAIGVNFIDTYFRAGLYRFPSMPGV
ncbi:MAG: quinone oxidoreductase, partial [Acetobacter sp.]